ncbi:class IV adenylate cyclase [Candidatus Woesearchaeota archaeon]|nr:class IV adenylate cyclase [Candidatus Woesearchaeota archaeon]
MHLNVEIKARCPNPQGVRDLLKSLGAEYRGLDHQIDTYFRVPQGRLKLREGDIENALVFYERNDQEGPKDSRVILYASRPGSTLKQALLAACGVLVVVDKQRQIYFKENVKFHVDEVNDLGSFCEIEAIDQTGEIGRERLLQQCEEYMGILGIEREDLISCSYSDLLLGMRK